MILLSEPKHGLLPERMVGPHLSSSAQKMVVGFALPYGVQQKNIYYFSWQKLLSMHLPEPAL